MIEITDRFLFSIGAALLVYELVVWGFAKFKDPYYHAALISPRVTRASKRWPIIPFAVGVLMGHWFWPNCGGCQ